MKRIKIPEGTSEIVIINKKEYYFKKTSTCKFASVKFGSAKFSVFNHIIENGELIESDTKFNSEYTYHELESAIYIITSNVTLYDILQENGVMNLSNISIEECVDKYHEDAFGDNIETYIIKCDNKIVAKLSKTMYPKIGIIKRRCNFKSLHLIKPNYLKQYIEKLSSITYEDICSLYRKWEYYTVNKKGQAYCSMFEPSISNDNDYVFHEISEKIRVPNIFKNEIDLPVTFKLREN